MGLRDDWRAWLLLALVLLAAFAGGLAGSLVPRALRWLR